MEKTQIQRQIEDVVTDGRGYDRKNHLAQVNDIDTGMNNEIGLQMALFTKDCYDHKISPDDSLDFMAQLGDMVKKFKDAMMPLDVITTTEGFKSAYNGSRSLTINGARSERGYQLI